MGKYVISSNLSFDEVCDRSLGFVLDGTEWYDAPNFSRNGQDVNRVLRAVCALICEHDDSSAWENLRDFSYTMWHNCDTYQLTPLSEITPKSDLYWAIRIGFADIMIEAKQQRPRVLPEAGQIDIHVIVKQAREELKEVIEKELRPIKTHYPDRGEIKKSIRQRMEEVYDILPGEVIDPLIDGESNFQGQRNTRQAILDFHLCVEKCLGTYLIRILDRLASERKPPIPIKDLPSRLSAGQWGRIFQTVAKPGRPTISRFRPYELLFKNYVKEQGLTLGLDDIESLGVKLDRLQRYRNEAKQAKLKPRAEEREDLRNVRNLVLGSEKESCIVTQILSLFAPRNEPTS